MTSDEFRLLALKLPGVSESSHMNHPDFRRDGKIFATLLYPNDQWGMVKLSPEEQNEFVQQHPDAFAPVKGAWGRQGCTNVRLETVDVKTLEAALQRGWARAAPKTTVAKKRRRPVTGSASRTRAD